MASTACFLHHHAVISSPAAGRNPSSRYQAVNAKLNQVVCKAQKHDENGSISRRLALTVLIGAAVVGSKVNPADAAYGEAANVFGKPKADTDFMAYNGDGFKLSVPSKWNPSKEREFPGQVLRFEDNFDATSNLSVVVQSTDKKSITDFGSPEQFLSQVNYLLGQQAYFGKTDSEVFLITTQLLIRRMIREQRKIQFKYFNMWSLDPGFTRVVQTIWQQPVTGTLVFQVITRLKNLKKPLRELN